MNTALSIQLSANAGNVTQTFASVATSATKMQGALNNTTKATGAAGAAVGDFSRILQDAAFGPAAIANNLNPLVESLTRLRTQAGSTGGVFKSLLSSLAGGGGLNLAFGAFTLAASLASVGLSAWTRAFGPAKKEAGETKKVVDDFSKSLLGLAAAAAGDSVANIFKISLALNNVSLSTDQRRKALEEYNKVAADSNKLSETDLSNMDKVNAAISRQVELLKTRALFKGAEDKLAEAFKKVFAAQFQIQEKLRDKNPTLADFAELMKPVPENTKEFGTGLTMFESVNASKQLGVNFKILQRDARAAGTEVGSILKFMDGLLVRGDAVGGVFEGVKTKAKEVKKEVVDIAEVIRKLLLKPVDFSFVPSLDVFKKDLIAAYIDTLNSLAQRNEGPKIPISADIQAMLDQVPAFKKVGEGIGAQIGVGFDKVFASQFEQSILTKISKGLNGEQLESFKSSLQAVSVVAADMLGGIANASSALFEALVSGGNALQAFGQSLIQTISGIIQKLIQAAALAAVLSVISGATGGSANFLTNFKGILGGGRLPGGATNFAPLDNMRSIQLGRNGPQQIFGELRARGGDLVAVMRREERSQNRRF